MKYGIDRYVGKWTSKDDLVLDIQKIDSTHAVVSLFSVSGEPICRPYWDDRIMVKMPADYDDYNGEFIVELRETGRGFSLHLDYHLSEWAADFGQVVLSPSLSRYEADNFLGEFYNLFGTLKDYRRTSKQKNVMNTDR